jgi:hypothetical protein
MNDALAWFGAMIMWSFANPIGQVLLIVCFMAIVGVVVGIGMGRRWLS